MAWLLCAACGPLREQQAQLAGVCLAGEAGLLQEQRRCYAVAEAPPFPELRRMVAANAAVQDAMELVENARCRTSAKVRPLTHAEIAGSARAALLLGKGKAFMQRYKQYVQVRNYEWHPDPEHVLFWEQVLGPGWSGSDAVPPGAARDEVVLMGASAFAFCAAPADAAVGTGVYGAPAGEEFPEVAAALRAADTAELAKLAAGGSEAAEAAQELLAGRFDEAQARFEALFGRSEDNFYPLLMRHALPLLVYALAGGVLAAGGTRFLRVWFGFARHMAQHVYAPSQSYLEGEMLRFLDNLELVDALVNRNGCMVLPPECRGAFSRLPFAMLYAALPAGVRRSLPADALADAVEELARDGMCLLARLGASGLLQSGALSPQRLPALETLLEGSGADFCPVVVPPPAGERAYGSLLESVQRYEKRGYPPLQVPDALSPVLIASRAATGEVLVDLDGWALPEPEDPVSLRCMQKLACNGVLALEGASAAEFTRLFVSLQPQVDIVGSLALPGEKPQKARPQPVILLAHLNGGRCFASLRLRLLPGANPLMTPDCGLEVPVLERADGSLLAVRRNSEEEWRVVQNAVAALRKHGMEDAWELAQGAVPILGLEALAQLLRRCRELELETCWKKDFALKIHQPRGGLGIQLGEREGSWLEIGGGLPVDEGRVLEIAALLDAFSRREGDALELSGGEYVLLTPALERQLTLLELVCQEKHGQRGVAAAAIPLLEALEAVPASSPPQQPQVLATLPSGLQTTLRPYQEEGFRWLAERAANGLGALLADDMGLGKTVQVLALLLHAAEQSGAGAALVVAPVSLLGNWAEEAARFAPSLRVAPYDPKKPEALVGAGAGTLVLASYGQISAHRKEFAAQRWEVLVLDEAQAIKTPDSQRAKAVCSLRARARLCLTGTPIENSLLDLWSQMRFLNPGLLGTRAAFQRRFKKAGGREHELLRQVLAPLVLRRSKAEVLTQLPPLTETIEWVEFSAEERALYESLRRTAVQKLGQGSAEEAGVGILAELMRLRRACCHGKLALPDFAGDSAKLAAMLERVQELRAAGRRVLIFSQFTDVLDLAQESLQAAGVSSLRLDGSTPTARRNKAVKAFQEGGADAFLISLKAGGAGLNLTAADYVMLLDPWWNPAVEAQAAGRSHRMGQQNPVTLCRFMVRDTVEERILALHKEKLQLAEQVLAGTGAGMSLANLRALLG